MGTGDTHQFGKRSRTQSVLMLLTALVGVAGSVLLYIMLHPGGRREIAARLTIEPLAAMLIGLCTTAAVLLFLYRLSQRAAEIERQIAQATALRDAIINSANYSIVSTDARGVIRTFNAVAERMLGYKAEEVIGVATPVLFHRADVIARYTAALSAETGRTFTPGLEAMTYKATMGRVDENEWVYVRKDRSEFPVRVSVTAMRDAEGHVTGFVGVGRDITQEQAAERELRKLSIVASRTDNAVILTDPLGMLEWVNDGFTRITGYTLDEVRGRAPGSFLRGPLTDRAIADEMSAKVRAGEGFHVEILNYTKSGAAFWNSIDGQPIHDASGALTGFLAIERDVTERKRAQEALSRQAAELEVLVADRTADLVRTNRELQEAMAQREIAQEHAAALRDQLAHVVRHSTMGEMASGLAHELNQPLWAIINYLQGALHMTEAPQYDMEKLRSAMTRAAAQAERAGQIIQRLREFVAKRPPEHAAAPLEPLVREVAELLAAEIRQGHVELRIQIESPGVVVFADRIQVQQVLVNLMRNAIEAMSATESGPRVLTLRINYSADPKRIQINVTDTGPGCDAETLLRIFEPFYTTKPAGMGMGLAICHSIVESHGGKLEAHLAAGRGMSFGFSLPLCREAENG